MNIGTAIPHLALKLQTKVYALPQVVKRYRVPAFIQRKNEEYLGTAGVFLNLPPTVFMVP
jgi:hypothetical protein